MKCHISYEHPELVGYTLKRFGIVRSVFQICPVVVTPFSLGLKQESIFLTGAPSSHFAPSDRMITN
jgi:hypothetical protein